MHIMKNTQQGIVLMITLVVLIVMTLGALAIARSMDATTMIAGNLAFRQSANYSADVGTEVAITWLDTQAANTLQTDVPAQGYWAAAAAVRPADDKTWDTFWTETLAGRSRTLPTDAVGNTVSYVVDRLCPNINTTEGCIFMPGATTATPGGFGEGALLLRGVPQVIYRITARVQGPRNTVSYVQTSIAK